MSREESATASADSLSKFVAPPKKANHKRRTKKSERNAKTTGPSSQQPKYVPPPASTTQKVVMGIAVVLPFAGVILAMALMWSYGFMGWSYLAMMIIGWQITGLGVTIGLHRLATHRSFETYGWIRALWVMCGALSIEGSPIVWCATHRKHHEFSDHLGDPHSPHLHGEGIWDMLRGFWHAHTGWLFTGYWTQQDLQRYVPDLLTEPWLMKIDRLYYLWVAATLLIPAALGGLLTGTWLGVGLGFLWGGLVRVFVTHHITWSINSVCHVFGTRDYESNDESTNNVMCAVLGMGEGWHNNHHAFPTSARHGLRWWQLDESWLIIRGMELCGLAWNVKVPNEKQMQTKSLH